MSSKTVCWAGPNAFRGHCLPEQTHGTPRRPYDHLAARHPKRLPVQVSKRCSLNSISAQKLTTHAGATYQATDIGSPVHLINPVTMN